MSFNQCIELGLSMRECNAITEPLPSLVAVATAVAIIVLISLIVISATGLLVLKAKANRND